VKGDELIGFRGPKIGFNWVQIGFFGFGMALIGFEFFQIPL
jgi:hypothetical protein